MQVWSRFFHLLRQEFQVAAPPPISFGRRTIKAQAVKADQASDLSRIRSAKALEQEQHRYKIQMEVRCHHRLAAPATR
jgi:hypothetical protein